MMEISSVWVMIVGELLVVLILAASGLLVMGILRRSRERKAVSNLIAAIRERDAQRIEETRELLASRYHYQGEQLSQSVSDLIGGEKRFYQTVINLFLKRDAGALENLYVAVEDLTENYRGLQVPKAGEGAVKGAGVEQGGQRLEAENQRLAEQLHVTMDTMGKMLNEYSTMLGSRTATSIGKEKIMEMFHEEEKEEGAGRKLAKEDEDATSGMPHPIQVGDSATDRGADATVKPAAELIEDVKKMEQGDADGSDGAPQSRVESAAKEVVTETIELDETLVVCSQK